MIHISRKLLHSKLGENWYCFLGRGSPYCPSDEDILEMTGFVPHRGRPTTDKQKAFHTFWALTLCQTTQSREAEKNILHVVLHERRKMKWIMQHLEVTLYQTHQDKEMNRNQDETSVQWMRDGLVQELKKWKITEIIWYLRETSYQTTLGAEKVKRIKKTQQLQRDKVQSSVTVEKDNY